MQNYQAVLIWIFIGFFVIIGVISLLAIVGVLKTDSKFRRWAVVSFCAGVFGAVTASFNQTPSKEVPLYVTLASTDEIPDLVSGEYTYYEETKSGTHKPSSGTVVPTLGPGGWQAKLPQSVLDKPVELMFKDRNTNWWHVTRFYPQYNRQDLQTSQPPAKVSASHSYQSLAMIAPAFGAIQSESITPVQANAIPENIENKSLIKFNNWARSKGRRYTRTHYEWRVFVDEPPSVLTKIAKVEYLLHPTFPQPLHEREDSRDKFALDASGWGEFTIFITVRYKSGTVAKTRYRLDLRKGWPEEP